MALTYSLRYKKLNFFNKVLVEKEGEIVIDRQFFRLKGKGAQDQGEAIYFGDMKDMFVKEDILSFTTYGKDKYILSNFSNLFDSFLKDFLRVRNEYLADALFMKVGMMVKEYDGSVELVNVHGKSIPKGRARIQFYEGSILIIPEVRECFSVYLNFLKNHEFDEEDYELRLYLDNGQVINISKLGTSFDDARETMETLLGKMYEKVINFLNEQMPEFDAVTLLKLAKILKEGRFVKFSALKKIHEEMPAKVEELAFSGNPAMADKVRALRRKAGDDNFFISFAFSKQHESGDITVKSRFIYTLPDENLIALGQTSDPNDNAIHFFRIIMEQGDANEKVAAKILEIEQSLLIFRFDLSPIYKDRNELKKTRYRTAAKRLSFLRLLRKSYLIRNFAADAAQFEKDLQNIVRMAKSEAREAGAQSAEARGAVRNGRDSGAREAGPRGART